MRTRSFIELTLFGLLLVGAAPGTPALAQEADALRNLQVDDYFALKSVGDPHISPDGAWVAYTVETKDLENDRSETRLWMVPTTGGEAIPMTAKGNSARRPRWSPDGKNLAFLSASGDETQVFTLDLRGGERVQITNIKNGIEGYEWSPDGKRLVLLIRDPKPETKTKGPWVIDRLQIKEDYEGYLNRLRAHLYVHDLETKATVQITAGDYEDYDPVWSPDGSMIAFVSNRTAEPDGNQNTDIWIVSSRNTDKGQTLLQVTSNQGSDSSPSWSPDGKWITYVSVIEPVFSTINTKSVSYPGSVL